MAAGRVRELMAKHAEIELLLNIGEYQPGSDPVADEAVRKIGDTPVPEAGRGRKG